MMKLKQRFNATRFDFQLHVHTLQPWPAGNRAIAIGWQRGKRRRGATNSIMPLPSNERGGSTVVRFNEKINFKSTLYKVPGAAERGGQLGPFKRKCVILAILETDGRTHATAALGRVVIDLSEFASIDGQELRTFTVACNKAIQAAVGEPQLTITLRCRWKKAGADFTEDEAASMSTDQSGSSLGGNIKDFFTRMTSARPGRGGAAGGRLEQDLGGFSRGAGGMEAIGEDDGTPGGARRGGGGGGGGGGGAAAAAAFRDDGDGPEPGDSPRRTSQDLDEADWAEAMEYPVEGTLNLHDDDEDDDGFGGGGVYEARRAPPPERAAPPPPRPPPAPAAAALAAPPAAPSPPPPPAPAPAARAPSPAGKDDKSKKPSRWNVFGRRDKQAGSATSSSAASPEPPPQQPAPSPSRSLTPPPPGLDKAAVAAAGAGAAAAAPPPPRPASSSAGGAARPPRARKTRESEFSDGHGGDVAQLQDELLTAAATEFCVHLAQRPIIAGRNPARAVHAPARRIARTLVCLGRQDGVPFGHTVLRHIQSAVVANRSDVQQLAFWWTNACHMRGFLQSLNLVMPHGDGQGQVQMHWAAQTFVPRLLGQEKFIFDELVSYVWTHTLVPKVAIARARAPAGPSVNKRGAHEAALRKWLEALEAANAQLHALGREGHVNTLRQQVLLELLKRVDALLFHYLVNPDASSGSEAGASGDDGGSAGVVMDSRNPNMPVLDESMLFFTRGALTFGTGMQLKMACTRLQQWSFGDGGLRDIWAQLPEQGQALFRLLKGASDLLMMPKDMLLDDEIRDDTVALPVGTVAYICSRFQPDDYAPDGISPQVLAALRRASALAGVDSSAPPALEVEAECTYYSPTDDMVMEQVEVGTEPGLEYDDASEDELNAVSDLGADFGVPPPLRFKLLHQLWAAGVPRSRRVTIQRVDD